MECDKRDIGELERAQLERRVARDDVELDLSGEPLLLELSGDQARGEGRGVERDLQLARKIGDRADMVLVTMGQDDAGQPAPAGSR